MGDPVVEAVQRALSPAPWQTEYHRSEVEAAVRELAKTIRDLHYPVPFVALYQPAQVKLVCAHCHRPGPFSLEWEKGDWPCETAKLVYPSVDL